MNSYTRQKGFTIIELIVVFSILVILSTLGIVAFVNYSRIQALNAAASDVVTMLQTAKSRAQSQVKPDSGVCASSPLDSYKVTISPANQMYKLETICGGNTLSPPIETKTLPQNIVFANPTAETPFTFKLLTGGVEGALPTGTSITINGYNGQIKTITVYSDGRVVAQ